MALERLEEIMRRLRDPMNGCEWDRVQTFEYAIDAAARIDIDDGKRVHVEEIAGRDDVGAAKEHEAIAVGGRVRHMDDLHAFLVEKCAHLVFGREERLRISRKKRRRSYIPPGLRKWDRSVSGLGGRNAR